MDLNGSHVRGLTPESITDAGDANWSPDGSKLTFLDNFGPIPFNSDVFTMNTDGTDLTQLTSDFGNNLVPEYSPDGTEIVLGNFAPVTSTECCGPGDTASAS